MRLHLRRSTEAGPADEHAPDLTLERPPRPTPPHGRPTAAYAAVLDGEHLWLAVNAAPGTLALRDTGSGEVVALVGDHEDTPTYRSVRADLLALPGTGSATYDAVLVGSGGRAPRAVWTPPLTEVGPAVGPDGGPTAVPTTRDGSARFGLERAEDGTLRLHRRPVERPLPRLVSVTSTGDAVELHLGGVAGGELHLRAGGRDGDVVATVPVLEGRARIARDDVPLDRGRRLDITVAAAGTARPLARDVNDLRQPGPATLLPLLLDEADRPLWRLVWFPDATLGVRVAPRDDHPDDQQDDHQDDHQEERS